MISASPIFDLSQLFRRNEKREYVVMYDHPVVHLERGALSRWCSGDPSGFLEISAPDVVYFDPFQPARIDGIDKLTAYYESLRGKVFAHQHEMIDPHVIEIGNAAVLTFRFVSYGDSGNANRWNCTEVYRWLDGDWRIVQTHWSLTTPELR